MGEYLTELHLHTKEVSPCGWLPAEEMVRLYHEAGYTTLVVTDHFGGSFFDACAERGIGYEEGVHRFFAGFRAAEQAARAYDMHVLAGAELSLRVPHGHFLLFGDGIESFLTKIPNAYFLSPQEMYPLTQAADLFLVQAHPYRGNLGPLWNCVDGLEVHNTNPRHLAEEKETQVRSVAAAHGLCMTGGSDAHRIEDVGRSGIRTKQPVCLAKDLLLALKNGEYTIIGCEETV